MRSGQKQNSSQKRQIMELKIMSSLQHQAHDHLILSPLRLAGKGHGYRIFILNVKPIADKKRSQ
jgi:hypothetical protein